MGVVLRVGGALSDVALMNGVDGGSLAVGVVSLDVGGVSLDDPVMR